MAERSLAAATAMIVGTVAPSSMTSGGAVLGAIGVVAWVQDAMTVTEGATGLQPTWPFGQVEVRGVLATQPCISVARVSLCARSSGLFAEDTDRY